jgi:branched-chain amino acid transport system permease protein
MRVAEGYYLIVYAALIMVMMAFCPSGLLGLAERLLKAAARGRRLTPMLRAKEAAQ